MSKTTHLSKPYHPHGTSDLKWWQTAVSYQIHPRSFQDTDGASIGNLQGIVDRLDCLVELGINTLWISPIFPSSIADFDYLICTTLHK